MNRFLVLKSLLYLAFFALVYGTLYAQPVATCYRLSLADKQNNPYAVNQPSQYLSARALAKRARFSIPITEQDLPVTPQYLSAIKAIDSSVRVLCTSKWMNTATVYCPDTAMLRQILNLPFVTGSLPVAIYQLDTLPAPLQPDRETMLQHIVETVHNSVVSYNYGAAYGQIAFHNGHLLHNLGFRGDSMLIAVFDGGWDGMDTASFFRNVNVCGTRDLMPYRNNVYEGHYHGTIVTSTMCGNVDGMMVGTAPEASYFLIRSEDPYQEQLIEEDFWTAAAEIADSIGADVINSSLGYTDFTDFPPGCYSYADMNGTTSMASRAATILGQKGVVVCVSAGNQGGDEWHYISLPADAFDILTVGAVDSVGNVAYFSSRGPSSDGRVKPDIVSVGVNTACVWDTGMLGTANGTSLSGPVAAGLCACLWQALPEKTASELMQIVRESSSCYSQPNDSLGYGIPDFYAAYVRNATAVRDVPNTLPLQVYPVPCSDFIRIPNQEMNIERVEIFSVSGQLLKSVRPASDPVLSIDVHDLPSGLFVGQATGKNGSTGFFRMMKE
jgi:serine protease AprX